MFCNMIWSSQLSRRQFRWMKGLMGGLATMELVMLKHGRMLSHYGACEFRRAYMVFRCALNLLAERAIGDASCTIPYAAQGAPARSPCVSVSSKKPEVLHELQRWGFSLQGAKRVAGKKRTLVTCLSWRCTDMWSIYAFGFQASWLLDMIDCAWWWKRALRSERTCRVHFFETQFWEFPALWAKTFYIYIKVLFCNIIWLKYSDELFGTICLLHAHNVTKLLAILRPWQHYGQKLQQVTTYTPKLCRDEEYWG